MVYHLQLADFLLLLLLTLAPTILLLRTLFFSKTLTKNLDKPGISGHRLPPSPLAFPIIGHLHLALGRLPHQTLAKVADRYGPILYLRFGYKRSLLVSSAEIARECLKTNESCFLDRPQRANFDYLTYGGADFSVAPYAPFWKFMRKLTVSKLLGASIMEVYQPIRREEIGDLIQTIHKKAEEGKEVDMGAQFMGLTNNVISRMALKQKCAKNEDDAYEMRHVIDEMCDLAGALNVQDFIWFLRNLDLQRFGKRLKNVRERYDKLIGKIIEEHEEAKRKRNNESGLENNNGDQVKDILDMLLDVYKDESSEIKLTKENIHAYVMNIFGAGTETNAVTMEWALSELITHPEVMSKARQEIDQVIGAKRIVTESDIPNLPYIQAVVKETLRLHPGGPFIARESSAGCVIGGYYVPANTRLFVNTWAINRDPRHWDSPSEFLPERFLREDGGLKSDLDVRGQCFHLLPFGSGRRGCPGVNLALLVVPTAVAALVQCFDWKVGEDGSGVVDMGEGFGLSLPKAKPLVCYPMVRAQSFPSTCMI